MCFQPVRIILYFHINQPSGNLKSWTTRIRGSCGVGEQMLCVHRRNKRETTAGEIPAAAAERIERIRGQHVFALCSTEWVYMALRWMDSFAMCAWRPHRPMRPHRRRLYVTIATCWHQTLINVEKSFCFCLGKHLKCLLWCFKSSFCHCGLDISCHLEFT